MTGCIPDRILCGRGAPNVGSGDSEDSIRDPPNVSFRPRKTREFAKSCLANPRVWLAG